MIDVLIVDDEPVVIELLRKEINWVKYDMRVVGYAHDGIAAINFLKKRNVDIVFTDVKMPHMGGLEFIERVHEFLPELLFVVISSYSDFNLVRQSFQNGVFDYILKIDIDNDKVVIPLLEKLRDSAQRQKSVSGEISEAEQLLKKSDLCIEDKKNYFYKMLTISLKDTAKAVLISELLFILRENAANFVFGFSDWKINILCYGDKKESVFDVSTYITNKIYTSLESERIKQELVVGGSDIVSYSKIDTLYEMAESALDYGFYIQGEALFTYVHSDLESYLNKKDLLFCLAPKVFGDAAIDDFIKAISAFFEEAFLNRVNSKILAADISLFFNELIKQIEKRVKIDITRETELLPDFMSIKSFLELKETCQKHLCERSIEINSQINMNLSDLIKAYIESHYSNTELCIQDIADEFNVGKRVISNCFAEKMNSSFKNYLNYVRIEKAKELLTHSSLRINEISSQIGYANAEHFSRIFSERVGESPMAYLKNNRM